MTETSLGLTRKSLAIFGNLQKFFGKCLGTFVWPSDNFWRISEISGKWSEIFGKSSKTPSSVCLSNITRQLEDMNFTSGVLLENTPLIKCIRNHIRDSGGVFSISSLVKISMITQSLKWYLNSLVYDRNIFGSSSKVFGYLR